MDPHSLTILEFGKVRELVAGYAPALGRDRVLGLQPSTDRAAIVAEQELVAEMMRAIGQGKAPALREIGDVRPAVRRAATEAPLTAEQLREVAAALQGLKRLGQVLGSFADDSPHLAARAVHVFDCSEVARDIEAAIDERGQVADSASRELSRLRQEIAKLDRRIRSRMQRMVRTESLKRILSFPNFTVTASHYVLPVARDHRHEVAGVVHRTSASGDTLYIEPSEVAEMSAECALLRSHESREMRRVLRQLSAAVGKRARIILESLEVAAELSCVYAKAQFARDYAMVQPVVVEDGRLVLEQARHPLLEHVFRQEACGAPPAGSAASEDAAARHASPRTVVPITVRLGERFDLLLVTGPNTGGKTVALKTVGLLALMAQAGLHIPAVEGSMLPVFDQILADIGDEQSIEQSLSTFSSHVSRIAQLLSAAGPRSLVLLDELGAGTDPAEGAALGRAILDQLLHQAAKGVITTHLGDLKTYALTQQRVENAAVEFDVESLRPTYRVRVGDTGRSCALVIARRLNLPTELVDRAEEYLASSRTGRPQELEVLEQRRVEAEAARAAAWTAEQEARRVRESYEARLQALEQDAADARALEEFRATLQAGDRVLVRKFRRAGRVLRVDHSRRLAIVAHGSMHWELSLDELLPERDPVGQ
jgi:DNA mismatch repair protein MutS2